MMNGERTRLALSLVLIVAGALSMLLSPSVQAGVLAFGLGVLLELVGLALRHRKPR